MDVQASSTAGGSASAAGEDGAQPLPDYGEWIGRTETLTDTASRTAAIQLGAILDRPADPALLTPLGHWLQFTPTAPMSELGPDGHPKLGGFMPPLPFPRRMWAGSELTYLSPIRLGAALEKTSTIESITPKEGRSGRLCFVGLRHDLSADGTPAITERQTIVYREASPVDPDAPSPARPPREDQPAPEGWDWARAVRPGEVTLFRYSAVTFNSHRIHYDLPYATQVEGYPGLVVHGPLSATLLVDAFQQEHPGAQIVAFEFSARSPLFANEQAHLCGRAAEAPAGADEDVRAQELAVVGPGGLAITAKISFR
ncbi:FAS1-like dehydratase domain-containing protein [Brevibacterium album]|uniref:FAS1-like dehydratase domain-containing protein n=1 Tax=Brevibacterium album TaxID=417948 RepID=UPI0004191AF0|nr:MaoC family dehydratase N-terminal domain-containing protein [Brevibacterium album]